MTTPRRSPATPSPSTTTTNASVLALHRRNGLPPASASGGQQQQQQTHPSSLRPTVLLSSQRVFITVGGCAAYYSAELTCAPDAPVTLSPGNVPTCIRVTPSLQVFTKENYNKPQFFRVAAIGNASFDDNLGGKEDRKYLQVIDHFSTSTDPRFHGRKLLFLPSNAMAIHVSPRDGCCVSTCGRVLGTAKQIGKGTTNGTYHDLQELDLDTILAAAASTGPLGNPGLVARSSVVAAATRGHGAAAAVAAVEAANTATSKRRQAKAGSRWRGVVGGSQGDHDSGDHHHHVPSVGDSTISDSDHHRSMAAKENGGSSGGPHTGLTFIKVACRKNQTVVLQRNGQMTVLGKRDSETSSSSSSSSTTTTTAIGTKDDDGDGSNDAALSKMLVDLDCGDDHIVALTEHGYLLTWGDGKDGRLGHGSDASRAAPRLVKALLHKRIVQVSCGARHTFSLAEDGDVYAWGFGKSGALGLGMSPQSKAAIESVAMPMEVLTLKQKGVSKISCGDMHTAVVLVNGALLTCGWAEHGRLGRVCGGGGSSSSTTTKSDGEYSSCFAPVDLKGKLCTFVACGGAHTLALTACKSIYAFGSNSSGQLGLGDSRHRFTPTRVTYFDDDAEDQETSDSGTGGRGLILTGIATGKLHSFAMAHDTRVFAWGSDEFGQCGIGSFPQIYTMPHLVPSAVGLRATQVAGGDSHSVMLCQSSQKHLDAMEANQPSQYAALMDRFEWYVRDDRARRARVLHQAKQRQETHDTAVRQRKPPLDPSILRGPQWQSKLLAARSAANELVEHSTSVPVVGAAPPLSTQMLLRPQTATALTKKSHCLPRRPATGIRTGTRAPLLAAPATSQDKPKVRCSSATLWRQTRLFTFGAAASPRLPLVAGEQEKPTISSSQQRPLKLTAEARKCLGRIFHDEETQREAQQQQTLRSEQEVSVAGAAAQFPASRPKSAPSRAATRAS